MIDPRPFDIPLWKADALANRRRRCHAFAWLAPCLESTNRPIAAIMTAFLTTMIGLGLAGATATGFAWAGPRDEPPRSRPIPALPLAEIEADPAIPTLKAVVGHDHAQDMLDHAELVRYFEALHQAAPDRSRWVQYGESIEKRSLNYMVISSKANLERLDAIRRENLDLAEPRRVTAEQAQEIAQRNPAIVWLAFSVHGDETSPTDAAALAAYHLLADQSATTRQWLEKVVVILDPLQNPDGRMRFLAAYREHRGRFPQGEPLAWERGRRGVPGRLNHYGFDMNRDWFNQTQPESRAKVAAYLEWQPHLFVDVHEMGGESTYFFNPPMDPINPQVTAVQRGWWDRIGRVQADWFDRFGFSYTTREIFDDFFPGYGSSWPTLQGGLGILWEQAGVRGLIYDRFDQTRLTFPEAVSHHYVSVLATIEAVASDKVRLLTDFHKARSEAIELGKGPVAAFVVADAKRPIRLARFAAMLARNGIELQTLSQPVRIEAEGGEDAFEWPAGSLVVPVAQPAGRLVRALLDRDVPMDPEFVQRETERRKRGLSPRFYDLTAWNPAMTAGLTCRPVSQTQIADWSLKPLDPATIEPQAFRAMPAPPRAKVAYLIPPRDDAVTQALPLLLREGIRAHVVDQPFTLNGREFERGTIALKVAENDPDALHRTVLAVHEATGVEIVATDTGYVEKGAHLGGPEVKWIKPPKVAMAVDRPVSPFVGHTWFLFDEVWGWPTTRVSAADLTRLDLDRYDVVILGDAAGYSRDLGDSGVAQLKEWVARGGTLILVQGAAAWGAGKGVDLLASRVVRKPPLAELPDDETDTKQDDHQAADKPHDESESDSDLDKDQNQKEEQKTKTRTEREKPAKAKTIRPADDPDAIKAPAQPPDEVPGTFLRATVDLEHWSTFGLDPELEILYQGRLILTTPPKELGEAPVRFKTADELIAGGFAWPESVALMAETPYLSARALGKGHVLGFTHDPNFRACCPATQRLFFNLVFFGPAH